MRSASPQPRVDGSCPNRSSSDAEQTSRAHRKLALKVPPLPATTVEVNHAVASGVYSCDAKSGQFGIRLDVSADGFLYQRFAALQADPAAITALKARVCPSQRESRP